MRHYLYNDEVEVRFENKGHKYFVTDPLEGLDNDNGIPSSTGVLSVIDKPGLLWWVANSASDYVREHLKPGVALDEIDIEVFAKQVRLSRFQKSDRAKAIGSLGHRMVERDCLGEEQDEPTNPEVLSSWHSWLEFKEASGLEVIDTEFLCYSRQYSYVGTCDIEAIAYGKAVILDLKTSKGIYPDMHLQTASYEAARREEYPEKKYAATGIVRVPKDGGELEVAWRRPVEVAQDFEAFKAARRLWKWKKENDTRR